MGGVARRDFLRLAVGAAALAGLAACTGGGSGSKPASRKRRPRGLPEGKDAPFDHVVVLMMENRSFDHLLGWLPGADGKQAGLTYVDAAGAPQQTWDLGRDFQGCTYRDPQHQWQAAATQLNGGKADGFLLTQPDGDRYPIGYYTRDAVPITAALATGYTTLDRYFSSLNAATWPNRLYLHAAQSDLDITGAYINGEAVPKSHIQTAIWDRLADAHLSGLYYQYGEPMTGVFASRKYDAITVPIDQFATDARAGALPNVAFVEPNYQTLPELFGTSNDDHPHGSIRSGEGFVRDVYDEVTKSPQWDRTVMVLTFDEWGGFFDHVPPPKVVDDYVNPNPGPHPDYRQLGFRVPCIVISPFAPARIVHDGPYEHCSILRMIEWRWDLAPMTTRDAHARNLAEVLDFSARRAPVRLPAFTAPAPVECPR